MTAEPVQVLVTIYPPEGVDIDWLPLVHEAMQDRDGWPPMPLGVRWFETELVSGQPHGEAKAHREAAEFALRLAGDCLVPCDDATIHCLAAITHALLALGERP